MAKYDVFGMCNPLFDIQAEVSDELLAELGLAKGSMSLVDAARQRELVPRVYSHIVNSEAGGSGANTMIGIAQLGGTGVYTGHVGDDEHARHYREGLEALGIKANLGATASAETGICLVLITPDAQRTMATCLGASPDLHPGDVDLDDLRASEMIYITAYLWDTDTQKEAVLHAMHEANRAGVRVALSLSDPFCVRRHMDDLLKIARDHVDVLFGNWQEAQVVTGTDNPDDAARVMSEWSDLAIVTKDQHGAILRRGSEIHDIPVYDEPRVDTTGAGDIYASGILYGLTHGLDLATTGRIATYVAGRCVATLGPRLDSINAQHVARIRFGGHPYED